MKTINKKNIEDIFTLTPMQEGILYYYLKNPGCDQYVEQLSLEISGEIHMECFERSWNHVIQANDMLRAVFQWEKVKNPVQIILKQNQIHPEYYDLSGKEPLERERRLEEIKLKDKKKNFNLQEMVPFRVTLCKIQDHMYEMIISSHHILYDGWSSGIILKEFFGAYNDILSGKEALKPVKGKFKEFIQLIRYADKDKQENYWKNYLNGFDRGTAGPNNRKTRKNVFSTGNYLTSFLPEIKDKLEGFTREHKITLPSMLYSAWGLILQHYHSTDDVVFDGTVSGRTSKIKGIEDTVGLFITTLPLRVQTYSNEKILDFLKRNHGMLMQWEESETSSLGFINEYLDEFNRQGIFDSVVVIENYPLDKLLMQRNRALSVNSFNIQEKTHHDLTVIITPFGKDGITVRFTYNRQLFSEEIMKRVGKDFLNILRDMMEHPGMRISDLQLLFQDVREWLLERNHFITGANLEEPFILNCDYVPAGNAVEDKLVDIWSKLFRVHKTEIGINRNFFDFGGHSLKASLLVGNIQKALNVNVPLVEIFKHPTINELGKYIAGKGGAVLAEEILRDRYIPLKPVEKREYYYASPAQKRLYMLQQLNPGSTGYNGPSIIILQGLVDKDRISQTFKQLIERHESLRTFFASVDGDLVQRISDAVEFEVAYDRLHYKWPDTENTENKKEYKDENQEVNQAFPASMVKDFIGPFDLSQPPLMRVKLVETGYQKYLLMIDMHHIITDGTSVAILTREFGRIYSGKEQALLKIQYKDFSCWQNNAVRTGKLKQQESYWLNHLRGELPMLDMPTDYPRPTTQRFEGERIGLQLDTELIRQLKVLMKETGTTLYMVLLAVYNILLSWYTRQEDIIIGTPIAGRKHADLENIMGLFLETLVIRSYPKGDKSFDRFLEETRITALEVYENQDYPFRELVKHLKEGNDLSRNPLFDAMLNVLNQESTELEIDGIGVTPFDFQQEVSKVDFTFEAREAGSRIILELEYCTALFTRRTMEGFACHFVNVLREVVRSPKKRISELEILSEKEKKQILEDFNTCTGYVRDETVLDGFEKQVEKSPDCIAVVGTCAGVELKGEEYPGALTFAELKQKSNQLALLLRVKGVHPDTLVGIMTDASPWLIVGIMGILKSGAAYLPLDAAYPGNRLEYMLMDSDAPFLITEKKFAGTVTFNGEMIEIDNWNRSGDGVPISGNFKPVHITHPDHLAYIIYTSGSTGTPKGIMVNHKNLISYLYAFEQEFKITSADVVIQQASCSFDAFGEEVFPALTRGARLAIPGKGIVKEIALLSDYILRENITIIDCSPLLLNELNKLCISHVRNPLKRIRRFISGGDVLKGEYVDNLTRIGQVYNTYGPTETTICATYYKLNTGEGSIIPIGKPVANYRVYILGKYDQLLPVGIPGEICISGPGVTVGYLNRPELTREKFVPYFSPDGRLSGKKLYKTGDLGKWLPAGNIEFLGRIDRQVNIRGFRIELGEIETQLLSDGDIDKAIVTAIENNILCAYFSGTRKKDLKELRYFLSTRLPEYMVPGYFVQLEQMPLTPQGKINIKALPEPGECRHLLLKGAEYKVPESELEKRLVKIWQELLGIDRIGIKDNFFELGGDSILANQCLARIHQDLNMEFSLREFFESPFIERLAQGLQQKKAKVPPIKPMPREGKIPLSFSQERLWFLQQLDAENLAYYVPRVIRIKGELSVALMERTLTEIIRRHEILRTVFPVVDGEPQQEIRPCYSFVIPVIDISSLGVEDQSTRVNELVMEEAQRKFDLQEGPLLRVTLLKLGHDHHILMLTEHHLIHDGWTQGVLLGEFMHIFSAYREGGSVRLPELPIQYADYALWQRKYLQGERLEGHLNFWKKKLAGLPPLLKLPTDRPRPTVISGKGDMIRVRLTPELSCALRDYSKDRGVTLFMTMIAVFKVLLYRYSGMEDLCVGSGIANRRFKELEGMLGMLINTIALRTHISGDLSFDNYLERVKATCLESYEHEDTPFGKVVEVLQPERSLSYTPIFQVIYSFMDIPTDVLELPGLEINVENFHNRSTKFDINIVVVPSEGRLDDEQAEIEIEWEYSTDIFDDRTMEQMLGHYVRLMEEIVTGSGVNISQLSMLKEWEEHQLLYELNNTAGEYPGDKTIFQLFAGQVERTPDCIALVCPAGDIGTDHGKRTNSSGVHSLSYGQLNQKSDQLAHILSRKGVRSDIIVALAVERSIEMMVGIFGILKAGGAYLPIDPAYPSERKTYILADSKARILLSRMNNVSNVGDVSEIREMNELSQVSKDCEIIDINSPGVSCVSDSLSIGGTSYIRSRPGSLIQKGLAYVIYTSGSTGRPKGVAIEHGSLVNRLNWMQKSYPISRGDIIMQKTPAVFDVSVWEIFWWSFCGASLFLLAPGAEKNPEVMIEAIEKNKVSTMHFVPSMLNVFLEYLEESVEVRAGEVVRGMRSLRQVFSSGEALMGQQVDRFNRLFRWNTIRLINLYGPTEAAIDVTYFNCPCEEEERAEDIPIGKPIDNIQLYIISKSKGLQPIGVAGELCISGVGLARGYINRPELSKEKFSENVAGNRTRSSNKKLLREMARQGGETTHFLEKSPPGRRRQRIYKTGDLARWLADGNIEFSGRMDYQIKIRGFRIEPGEIEQHLLRHKGVKEAVVITRTDTRGDMYLCGYIVPHLPDMFRVEEINSFLQEGLPDHMVPAYFVIMDSIPLTLNGKIDRKVLPEPDVISGQEYTAPRDEIESLLVEIWAEVLGIESERIGIDDNFFKLGGHSLKVAVLLSRIHRAFNLKLSFTEIFKAPVIRSLAGYIARSAEDRNKHSKYICLEPMEKQEYYFLSSAQNRLYIIQQMQPDTTAYNIPQVAILAGKLNLERLEKAAIRLIRRHESLRTSFETVDGKAVQKIHREVNFSIEFHQSPVAGNWSLGEPEEPSVLDDLSGGRLSSSFGVEDVIGDFIRPFDLSAAPLLRAGLIKTGEINQLLMLDMHHIVSDAVSMEILIHDFIHLYEYDENEKNKKLPSLKLQYTDFSVWQNKFLKSPQIKSQEEYWLEQLSGEIPELKLPFDYERTEGQNFAGDKVVVELGEKETTALREIGRERDATMNMILLAVFNVLLLRYSNQEDIVVGIPIAGRRQYELGNIIGMFVNTLALRNYPTYKHRFTEFLEEVKECAVSAYENQDFQFDTLIERLRLKRSLNRNPLFDVFFTFQGLEEHEKQAHLLESGNLSIIPFRWGVSNAKFDLMLAAFETKKGIRFEFTYSSRLFKPNTIKTMSSYFKTILSEMIENPGARLSEIKMIDETEELSLIRKIKQEKNLGILEDKHVDRNNGKNRNVEFNF